MSNATDSRKKAMISALKRSLGIVSTAADNVGVTRQSHYAWLKDDPEYKKDVEDISEAAIDFAESKLMEKMNGVILDTGKHDEEGENVVYKKEPSDTALIFYLKTKGKSRGYVERTENVIANTSLEDLLDDIDE